MRYAFRDPCNPWNRCDFWQTYQGEPSHHGEHLCAGEARYFIDPIDYEGLNRACLGHMWLFGIIGRDDLDRL